MLVDTLDYDATLSEAPVRFANFGVRLGAAVIDFLVLIPLVGANLYFFMVAPNFTLLAGISILSMLYKPLLEGSMGATLGKKAVKIKVVGKENVPLTMAQAFMRAAPWIFAGVLNLYFSYLAFQIPGLEDAEGFTEVSLLIAEQQLENGSSTTTIVQQLVGWLPLVSALVMLGNKRRQAAHDMLAESYVVYNEPAII